ncbi:MAG TPA: hypothetical protein VHP31_05175 [Caproicibacter sp.]|nr:hypothetical protein [Caproicibacter sp.]
MAGNSGSDRMEMNHLQQEAIRRAREMQARAQIPPAYVPPPPPREKEPPHPRQEQMPVHQSQESRKPPSGPLPDIPIEGALEFLMKDTERTLILILLLILLEEKSDTSLIFAMMYLLV